MSQQVLHSNLAVILQAFFRYGVSAVAEYAFRSEHLVVEPEPSLFLQFHYADCRYEFGNGSNPHYIPRSHCQGRIGILRSWTAVAYPVTLAENQGIIADHGQLSPVQMPVTHIFEHPGIHLINSREIGHAVFEPAVQRNIFLLVRYISSLAFPYAQSDNGKYHSQYCRNEYRNSLLVKLHISPSSLQIPESNRQCPLHRAGKCPRTGRRWMPYPSLRK